MRQDSNQGPLQTKICAQSTPFAEMPRKEKWKKLSHDKSQREVAAAISQNVWKTSLFIFRPSFVDNRTVFRRSENRNNNSSLTPSVSLSRSLSLLATHPLVTVTPVQRSHANAPMRRSARFGSTGPLQLLGPRPKRASQTNKTSETEFLDQFERECRDGTTSATLSFSFFDSKKVCF